MNYKPTRQIRQGYFSFLALLLGGSFSVSVALPLANIRSERQERLVQLLYWTGEANGNNAGIVNLNDGFAGVVISQRGACPLFKTPR